MIHYKTEEEIKIMSEGGKKLKQILKRLIKFVKPGITTLAIENEAQRLIKEEKAEVSFDKVEGYQFATCLPVNEQIVHTPPSERVLKKVICEVSKAIETIIKKNGYFVIKKLTGHGIGKDLHEDPFVFGFLDRPVEKTLKIKPGLVLAVEVIYSMGTEEMAFEKDNDWSIVTKDGSLSSCFEKTVAVTKNGVLILT